MITQLKIACIGIPIVFLLVSAFALPNEILTSPKAFPIIFLCSMVISLGFGIGDRGWKR